MPLRKLSRREIQSRPLRSLLTLLSIVIGVSAIVATSLASSSARLAQIAMVSAVTGNASLEIESVGGASFDGKPLEAVLDIPGVEVASPVMKRLSQMTIVVDEPIAADPEVADSKPADSDSTRKPAVTHKRPLQVRVQLMGIVPKLDKQVRNYKVVAGVDLADVTAEEKKDVPSILVDERFAKSIHLEVGSRVRFLTRDLMKDARVVGLTASSDASSGMQSGIMVAELRTVQRWFKSNGKIDSLQLVLKEDAKLPEVKKSVEALLPDGVKVRVPQLRSQLAQETTIAMEQGLRLAIAFALVIAGLVIYNTFQMNIGERRRQLGILRSLGATRKQLLWMIVREGLWLGTVGTLLGCIVGHFGAAILRSTTGRLLQIDVPQAGWSIWPYLVAAICGLVISFLGAFFPAVRAARMSPAEAMRVVATGEFGTSRSGWLAAGGILISTGLALQFLAIAGFIDVSNVVPGAVSMMLGVVFLLPGVVSDLTYAVTFVLGPILKTEGKLARRQLLRHRGRTSLTIGIVFIALGLGLGMASTILDNVRNVEGWHQRAIVGDFFVRAAMPDMNSGQAAEMPDGLLEQVRNMEGVNLVDSLDFVQSRIGETSVVVVVRNFSAESQDYFDLAEGKEAEVLQSVRKGDVVLGSVLAQRLKLHAGDSIALDTSEGTTELRIAGVANEYIAGGLTLYLESSHAKRLLGAEGADVIVVYAKPELKSKVEKDLIQMCDEYGLIFQSHSDLIGIIRSKLNGAVGVLWGVLAMGSVIAAFGLINTLAMNILEQTREIGMLRVVAMTRSQVRKMILAQAVIMGLIGIVPGVFAGVWIAFIINLTTMPVTGHDVKFQIYPWLLVGALAFEMLVILIAAMIPAERAARLNLSGALQYE